ncbi:MAG: class I SAM-dependent RNA methyltransferase [Leptospiraceae bacterium]|nr:class I SAM-dependent RNA methyltransferase [Leptospiraceae bacterium]MCP5493848.1 class I SAM-dependent RNA methyltransferase [Leptospiraceae bacterium]
MEEDKLVKIQDVNQALEGIGEWEGNKYSFRYANVGDEITFFTIGKRKRKKIIVKEHKVLSKIEIPICQYYYKCGGCSAQHLPYASQFIYKTDPLVKFYFENHKLESNLAPAQNIVCYRNRMDFAVFPEAIGLRKFGDFRTIVDIERCEIQSDWANEELRVCRELVKDYEGLPYHRKLETGYLKYITLRYGFTTHDSLTIFTFCEEFKDTEWETRFITDVCQKSKANNIVFCYNNKKSEVSASGNYKVIRGNHFYMENVMEQRFSVPFDSFFQPNPKGFFPILDTVEKFIADLEVDTLLDLFCGNGFFSLLFGRYFKEIYGFENVESSILQAEQNVKAKYASKKVLFKRFDLFQNKLDLNFLTNPVKTVAILDPPRSGAGKNLISVLNISSIPYILYVSCNPNLQKEEIEKMSNYRLKSILFADPFPHTPHFESIAVLEQIK